VIQVLRHQPEISDASVFVLMKDKETLIAVEEVRLKMFLKPSD
jgi:hypothetical protein